jgi:hypothetical protein
MNNKALPIMIALVIAVSSVMLFAGASTSSADKGGCPAEHSNGHGNPHTGLRDADTRRHSHSGTHT